MELIKTWALRIVLSSLMVGLVLLISPGGALEKPVKTVVSLFMLFTIIYPFFDVSSVAENFDFTDEMVVSDAADSGMLIAEQLEKEISEKIEILLSDKGNKIKVVDINLKLTEKNEITVDSAKVVVISYSEMTAEEIEKLIIDNCGLNADVEVIDENWDE